MPRGPLFPPQQSEPFAAFACWAILRFGFLAERSDRGRLPVAPAEHLDLSIECRRRAWLITQDRLQSFADLLINCRTVGVIDVNSVAHGDILTRSKPKQVSGAETAAIGYLRERLC